MGSVSVSLPSDGDTIESADYNTPITTIVNEINGGLDNSNIASDAAIAGSKLANSSVTAGKIDFGGSGAGVWWEEIARTTLTVAGDTISVTSIPARKYLKVLLTAIDTGGTINSSIRFNNDSTTTYATRNAINGAADSTTTAGTSGFLSAGGTAALAFYGELDIINWSTSAKIAMGFATDRGAGTSATAPGRSERYFVWHSNTQINRIDSINSGTGDYEIGSEMVILGHD